MSERRARQLVWLCFAVGLALRLPVFGHPHLEGDERIYESLARRLLDGGGYGLAGSGVIAQEHLEPGVYDHPIFHHPPLGPALMAGALLAFGTPGLSLLQLGAYAVFFVSMLALAREALPRFRWQERVSTATLSALQPIAVHVAHHHWLDAPQLAFATVAAAGALRAARGAGVKPWVWAGALWVLPVMVKLNALIVPVALGPIVWMRARRPRRELVAGAVVAGLIVAIPVGLWLSLLWSTYGTPVPPWVGRPNVALRVANAFVHHVTDVRTPLSYLWLLPTTCWTVAPSVVVWLGVLRHEADTWRAGGAVCAWVALVLVVHVVLAYAGYSRVLRYVILCVPALVLLFALAAGEMLERYLRSRGSPSPGVVVALGSLAAGVLLEAAQALHVARDPGLALIVPMFS